MKKGYLSRLSNIRIMVQNLLSYSKVLYSTRIGKNIRILEGVQGVSNQSVCTHTKELIKCLHKKGLEIFVYTIDNNILCESLLEMDVDGIITNYP